MKPLTQLLSHIYKYFKNFLVTWKIFREGVLVAKITNFLFPLLLVAHIGSVTRDPWALRK